MAPLIGALPEEITFISGLTENVHKIIATFYKPEGKRNKILVVKNEFPSDIYAVNSQIEMKGLNPDLCMVTVNCNAFSS